MSGVITSALIIAICGAGLHTLVNFRREQAKTIGVPYMDKWRRGVLIAIGSVAAIYFAAVALIVATGSQ